jgi:hypothetical protein
VIVYCFDEFGGVVKLSIYSENDLREDKSVEPQCNGGIDMKKPIENQWVMFKKADRTGYYLRYKRL